MLKSFPKILTIFFLATLFFQINTVLASCSYVQPRGNCGSRVLSGISDCQGQPEPANCGTGYINCDCCCDKPTQIPASASGAIKFVPQVAIPGYNNFDSSKTDTSNIATLVRAIYNYGIGIVGILAAVVLMYGGVLWIVAGGNTTQVGEAKTWIGAALTGLLLALTSYLILDTVNPALVNLQTSEIKTVAKFMGTPTGILKQAYGDSVIFSPNVTIDGLDVDLAKGIVDIKDICNTFYGGNDCKITITHGSETYMLGKDFTIGNLSTGITSSGGINYTIGDIIFGQSRSPNIIPIDKDNACLKSAGITYKLMRQSSSNDIRVVVDPTCS